ncbi:uncharacterized protein LOC125232080 [Leguminivora glycinivorella]|uniref:uncharacterized protein LOC125232080 n=1 Tax=Leguminivora glycinivorella TaxID=1035111 RepID=UPI00200EFB66|nr:uncharacterized protein LOC125232080 [Leguminivora glycinivorella]
MPKYYLASLVFPSQPQPVYLPIYRVSQKYHATVTPVSGSRAAQEKPNQPNMTSLTARRSEDTSISFTMGKLRIAKGEETSELRKNIQCGKIECHMDGNYLKYCK